MALHLKTIKELQELLAKEEITSEELVTHYLDRIAKYDPKIGSFITVDQAGALAQAKAVDDKRRQGHDLPAYAGIPIAIKDNICTKGLKTTCASKMLENFIPPYDATAIEKIKEQEMVILGKLNMDEFAMGSSTENSAFQLTRNPYDPERVPGGSSGGSAAAVAGRLAPFALGSDTGGSIRQPASYCGVYGLKPTYGRVSRYGLVAFASSLDQVGPLANHVMDLASLMEIISGYDRYDSSSANQVVPRYTEEITGSVAGMRIALPVEFISEGIDQEVKDGILAAVKKYQAMGAQVEEVHLDLSSLSLPAYYIISSAEASSNLARYDGIKYGHRTDHFEDLEDLYKTTRDQGFGLEVKRRIMLGTYALSSGYYDAYYKKAQQARTFIKDGFQALFKEYDAVLTPTGPTTAFKIGAKVDDPVAMYMNDICTVPVNIAGLPAISMNVGYDQGGLPIGLQLIGQAYDEITLLNLAYAYEQKQGTKQIQPKAVEV